MRQPVLRPSDTTGMTNRNAQTSRAHLDSHRQQDELASRSGAGPGKSTLTSRLPVRPPDVRASEAVQRSTSDDRMRAPAAQGDVALHLDAALGVDLSGRGVVQRDEKPGGEADGDFAAMSFDDQKRAFRKADAARRAELLDEVDSAKRGRLFTSLRSDEDRVMLLQHVSRGRARQMVRSMSVAAAARMMYTSYGVELAMAVYRAIHTSDRFAFLEVARGVIDQMFRVASGRERNDIANEASGSALDVLAKAVPTHVFVHAWPALDERARLNLFEYLSADAQDAIGMALPDAPAADGEVQRSESGEETTARVHEAAAAGIAGGGGALPYGEAIAASFGRHDISDVSAHVGGPAEAACDAMGANAYATGTNIAFRGAPDLHTAAHEAAHVVQQRAGVSLSGGVGRAGDAYEQHADAVADAVVAGESAEAVLDEMSGE